MIFYSRLKPAWVRKPPNRLLPESNAGAERLPKNNVLQKNMGYQMKRAYLIAASLLALPAAHAADDNGALAEIIVTAQRRAENLQTVSSNSIGLTPVLGRERFDPA